MEKIVITIIKVAVKAISPKLREVLQNVFVSLKQAAAATDNQWDDMLVEVLGAILDFE